MRSTPKRAPLSRDAIVDSARDLVSAEGLRALTLRRLADRFAVSAPALYAHFTDKEDLLRAVAARQFEDLIARYREIDATSDPARPLERVRAQCLNYVRMSQDDPELFRLMFLFPPDLGELVTVAETDELPAATHAFGMAVSALEDAIAAGHLEAQEAMPVALTLWAGVHGVTELLLMGIEAPAEDLAREVTERILRGYGATG